ncbi:hypothetical protein LTR40_004452 [Exophiala xenobiotica]|nr:hypothetical protein LTR40_004452 [Exophiala xenobiotica]
MEAPSRQATPDGRATPAPADRGPAVGETSGPVAPPTGSSSGTNTSANDPAWAKGFLLSFDGGGIRGLSSLFILRELMVQIQNIEKGDTTEPAEHSFCPMDYRAPRVNTEPVVNGDGRRNTQRAVPADEQLEPDRSGPEYKYLPCHYFDFIAGTSTGGLIAMMLGRLRMTVGHCIEEYIMLGAKVFGNPRIFCARSLLYWNRGKYYSGNVEKVVKHVARKYNPSVSTQRWEISLNSYAFSMVFATQEDDRRPYIFRSYDHKLREGSSGIVLNPGPAAMNPLSVVGRATSAAPGYFNPLAIGDDMAFLDGGLVANNPTHYAYHEVRQLQGNRPPKCVLSIGIGKKNKRSFKRLKKLFPHWAPFISLELNNKIAESESAHDQMRIELDQRQVDVDAIEYDRLTVDTEFGLGWMKLDEWKRKASSTTRARDAQPIARDFKHERDYLFEKRSRHHDTVEFIESRTRLYLAQDGVQNQLQRLARVLVETRRQRSMTWKWEHFATGETWKCPISSDTGCNGDKFNTQRDLERHLSERHGEEPHRATRECVIPY